MAIQPTASPPVRHRSPAADRRRPRRPWPLAAALALVAIVAVPAAYRWVHRDVIFPGVRVGGVAVGGRTATEALARLAAVGLDPAAPVTLRTGEREWSLEAGSSGLAFDARATAAEAWAVGRRGTRPKAIWDMLRARLAGRDIAPIVRYDAGAARAALTDVGARFNRPPRNAAIAFDGTAVHTTPPEIGRQLDIDASLARMEAAAAGGAWPVRQLDLAVVETPPAVTDAGPAVAAAQALLASPLTLRAEDQVWPLPPDQLAPMLTTVADGGAVRLDVDRDRLRDWLKPVTDAISRTATLPRFHFDDDAGALVLVAPGQDGKSIDVDGTAQQILAVDGLGDRLVRAVVVTTPAAVADGASAADLGIRELIRAETSHFRGSAPERIHNVALAASRFDGLLIPPDAVFSFNAHIGDISLESGFKKALIIMDGATADGVGGGVCQVSTTLFRAAFWSGLPIVERTAHGYRVGYYEQGAPMGFDATIYSPIVDLKFKNDTGAWILMETETNTRATALTFRFYGAKPDREVKLEGPVVGKNVPPPPPRTEVDPSLAPGQTKVVENARSGASVSLTRIVLTPGQPEQRDVFYSSYRPTGQVTAVGPGAPPAGDPAAVAPPPTPGASGN